MTQLYSPCHPNLKPLKLSEKGFIHAIKNVVKYWWAGITWDYLWIVIFFCPSLKVIASLLFIFLVYPSSTPPLFSLFYNITVFMLFTFYFQGRVTDTQLLFLFSEMTHMLRFTAKYKRYLYIWCQLCSTSCYWHSSVTYILFKRGVV